MKKIIKNMFLMKLMFKSYFMKETSFNLRDQVGVTLNTIVTENLIIAKI